MKITALHHAQITIPKDREEEARHFYSGLLGLKEIPKPLALQGRGGFWLQVGASQVHVGTEDGVARTRTKAHLAYEVDDLKAWAKLMEEGGVALGDSVPVPGFRRFEVRDPFGNRVEFIQPVEEQV